MKKILILFFTICFSVLFSGCNKVYEEDSGVNAPGASDVKGGQSKISFSYNPAAPKEWLRIQKGPGEGRYVDVYVGRVKVGSIAFGTVVQKIGEENGWYKIRYAREGVEFFGYIRFSEAAPAEKFREPSVIMVGQDAEPSVYTFEQVEEKLNSILRIPFKLEVVRQTPEVVTKKVFASSGSEDGYDDLLLLKRLQGDPSTYVYARKMQTELKQIYSRSPAEYRQIIELYGMALDQYISKNIRNFESNLESAEQKRNYYRRSF